MRFPANHFPVRPRIFGFGRNRVRTNQSSAFYPPAFLADPTEPQCLRFPFAKLFQTELQRRQLGLNTQHRKLDPDTRRQLCEDMPTDEAGGACDGDLH